MMDRYYLTPAILATVTLFTIVFLRRGNINNGGDNNNNHNPSPKQQPRRTKNKVNEEEALEEEPALQLLHRGEQNPTPQINANPRTAGNEQEEAEDEEPPHRTLQARSTEMSGFSTVSSLSSSSPSTGGSESRTSSPPISATKNNTRRMSPLYQQAIANAVKNGGESPSDDQSPPIVHIKAKNSIDFGANRPTQQERTESPSEDGAVCRIKAKDSMDFTKEHLHSQQQQVKEQPKPQSIQLLKTKGLGLRANDSLDQLHHQKPHLPPVPTSLSQQQQQAEPTKLTKGQRKRRNRKLKKHQHQQEGDDDVEEEHGGKEEATPLNLGNAVAKPTAATTIRPLVQKGTTTANNSVQKPASVSSSSSSSPGIRQSSSLPGPPRSPSSISLTSSMLGSGGERGRIGRCLKTISTLYSLGMISSEERKRLKSQILDQNEEVLQQIEELESKMVPFVSHQQPAHPNGGHPHQSGSIGSLVSSD
jgi:hypothetical protein